MVQLRCRIREHVDAYKRLPFQKGEGSRLSMFITEDKPLLNRCRPRIRYQHLGIWAKSRP